MADLKRPWTPTTLPPAQESDFQRDMMFSPNVRAWSKSFERQFGERPNLNDPGFDYRGAWKAGRLPTQYDHGEADTWRPDAPPEPPQQGEQYRWVSGSVRPPFASDQHFKAPDHPTMWMQDFLDHYGVVPEDATGTQIAQGAKDGVVPLGASLGSVPAMPPSPTIPDHPDAYSGDALARLAAVLAQSRR